MRPLLTLNEVLALIQSMLQFEQRKKTFFPLPPLSEADFGQRLWADACEPGSRLSTHGAVMGFFFGAAEGWEGDGEAAIAPGLDIAPLPTERIVDYAERIYGRWQETERSITFYTSGSTGRPKACTHSEEALIQERDALLPFVEGCRSVLSLVPPHHLYGFTPGLTLPTGMGLPVRRISPLPTSLASALQEGDLVIGLPVVWQALVAMPSLRVPKGVCAMSATAPISDETLAALSDLGFALLDIYGSSETGVAGLRQEAGTPYRLPPYYAPGEGETLLRRLPDGRLESVPLPDEVRWLDGVSFFPQKRRDKAVQVGGINVFPALVAKRLQDFEGVSACAVRLMRPEEGTRLKAFIVPEPGQNVPELKQKLRKKIREVFPPEERPVALTFGEELPQNDMYKQSDW